MKVNVKHFSFNKPSGLEDGKKYYLKNDGCLLNIF